jgi:hypothetical protein
MFRFGDFASRANATLQLSRSKRKVPCCRLNRCRGRPLRGRAASIRSADCFGRIAPQSEQQRLTSPGSHTDVAGGGEGGGGSGPGAGSSSRCVLSKTVLPLPFSIPRITAPCHSVTDALPQPPAKRLNR